MKKRFLVVSPHPDDAELGLGGTIIKLTEQGHLVFLVDLTSGEPTPYGSEEKRKAETQKATKILGIEERVNLGLENRFLFDSKEARLLVAEQIRLHRPDILFVPYADDAHPDHVAATRIAEAARFSAKYTKMRLKGKPHYPFYLFYFYCTHLRTIPQPSFLVDISRQYKDKVRAIRCYRSQFVVNPENRRVFDYIESLNRYLGRIVRAEYAEAIYSKEAIKVEDLSALL